jgi:hypothetical protein
VEASGTKSFRKHESSDPPLPEASGKSADVPISSLLFISSNFLFDLKLLENSIEKFSRFLIYLACHGLFATPSRISSRDRH